MKIDFKLFKQGASMGKKVFNRNPFNMVKAKKELNMMTGYTKLINKLNSILKSKNWFIKEKVK